MADSTIGPEASDSNISSGLQTVQDAALQQSNLQSSAHQDTSNRKPAGIFGQWLRRRDASPSPPLVKTTGRMEPAAVAQDQGTPTWSEASEASDFASVDVNQMSPAASHSVSAESPANTVAMEQQSTAKLADRLGGWLTGMSTVAGVVLGGAVRGGTKALQKLTAQERLQDLHAATQDLEATATDLQGEARTRVLTHWCQLLQQLHPKNLPANQLYSLSSLPPGSPHAGRSDNDWQQLHVARVEPATPKLAVSVPAHALSRPHQPAASAASDITTKSHSSDRNATGSGAEFWTNQVLYIGQLQEHEEQELLTFRELFLQSYALENIIVGHISHPPGSPDERKLLIELFGLCLAGDTAAHTCLVNALLNVAAVEAECRSSGTAGSLGSQQPALANVVAETICGIKIQAEEEILGRKMAALEGNIAEQAAEVHRCNKFDSGAKGPSADSSPTKLASGLVGTAKIMQMSSALHQLASQRAQQLAAQAKPQYEVYLETAKDQTTILSTALAALQAKSNVANKRKADGQAFRDRKLQEMDTGLQEVDQDIQALEEQKAELLRQLSLVQQQICTAQAKRADMEEGRHVFQEGNAFTLEALQHQADELSTQQRHHIAEGNALAGCQTLIQAAAKAWDSAQATSQASCQASMNQVQQEYLHAATRHLYYQRALLQLVLRQLNFCVSELQGVQQKESSLERMGMEGIIHDMRASKQRLLAKYTEAHAAAQHHLSDVAAVHAAVDEVCSPQEPATMAAPHARTKGADTSAGDASANTTEPEPFPHPLAAPAAPDFSSPHAQSSALPQTPDTQGASTSQTGNQSTAGHSAAGQSVAEQQVGASDELVDLFAFVEVLRQEVDALPDPGSLIPVTGQEQDLAVDTEDVDDSDSKEVAAQGAHSAEPVSQVQQDAVGPSAEAGKSIMASSASADSDYLLDASCTSP